MNKAKHDTDEMPAAKAIQFIQDHFQEKPSLEEIAEHVHLSPFHFQRLFSDWVGTSPKKFLQYIQVSYAKKLLKEELKESDFRWIELFFGKFDNINLLRYLKDADDVEMHPLGNLRYEQIAAIVVGCAG